ncbi:hypothetical protein ABT009_40200 [Streptomyces sp. NPDC002896]
MEQIHFPTGSLAVFLVVVLLTQRLDRKERRLREDAAQESPSSPLVRPR